MPPIGRAPPVIFAVHWAEMYTATCGRTTLTFGLIHLYERKQAMNLNLTEEQIAVRDAARDFAQNVLKPGVIERDRDQRFPADEVRNSESLASWA